MFRVICVIFVIVLVGVKRDVMIFGPPMDDLIGIH